MKPISTVRIPRIHEIRKGRDTIWIREKEGGGLAWSIRNVKKKISTHF